jgi:hypothetical protein
MAKASPYNGPKKKKSPPKKAPPEEYASGEREALLEELHSRLEKVDVEGKRTILDQDELMEMVRIAQTADTDKSCRARVYRWLETYRDDILFDCGIDSQGPSIEALCPRLKNDFAIRS